MRSIRGYHMHQRPYRAGASAEQSHDTFAPSSPNPYMRSEVLITEVLYRYLLTMNTYDDVA